MKIAILGTRGIPNNYGGFEQNAENLSVHWVKKGHEVVVYNTDEHPYKQKEWNGVKIKHIFARESKLGIWGTCIYDFLCLKDAISEDFDIILNMGYVPSALFFSLKKRTKAKFVTNMDGLEWKRAKWNNFLKKFIKFCERRAIILSDALISDNLGIRDYYMMVYDKNSYYIPYGATLFNDPDEKILEKFSLKKFSYYMLVARLEPENNIETILDGYVMSRASEPFIVVGRTNTKFGRYLTKKYMNNHKIEFVGAIYDYSVLSTLRWYSKLYFHGHSVGGTNPSLLEAMASNAFIAAHENPFNRYVLGNDAFYFKTTKDVASIIRRYNDDFREVFIHNNRRKIKEIYNWEKVSEDYLRVFQHVCEGGK